MQIAREFAIFAEAGEVFIKHGRHGKPHQRKVTVVLQSDHRTVQARWGPQRNACLYLRKGDAALQDGKQTKVFKRCACASREGLSFGGQRPNRFSEGGGHWEGGRGLEGM